ncbi:MAG: DUF2333 family protein, partial [Sphingomonadales bacterium]|nr:DUF2333 family protein [Sphingomonadales bacterium]
MMISDWFRAIPSKIWAVIKSVFAYLGDRIADVTGNTWKKVAFVAAVLIVLYYPIGMALQNEIDDNLAYGQSVATPQGGTEAPSKSIAVMAALIDREVNQYGWVMNDPFFKPGWMLDNMPNYQQGMFSSLARVAIEFRDQVGRTRGSSSIDTDLEEAAGLLPYPGDVWIFNFSTSLLPTASAERQYLTAMKALNRYNQRLVLGEAVFERRGDNLLATLDRIALDIGASSAAIDDHIKTHSDDWIDFKSDDLFYNVKGQTYAYLLILEALGEDYSSIIENRELHQAYTQMLDSFRE